MCVHCSIKFIVLIHPFKWGVLNKISVISVISLSLSLSLVFVVWYFLFVSLHYHKLFNVRMHKPVVHEDPAFSSPLKDFMHAHCVRCSGTLESKLLPEQRFAPAIFPFRIQRLHNSQDFSRSAFCLLDSFGSFGFCLNLHQSLKWCVTWTKNWILLTVCFVSPRNECTIK